MKKAQGVKMKMVLIVDDDELVRSTVSAMLSALKFNVTEAPNGKVALKLTSECRFDLIVTDLFMPEIDGLELVNQIRKISPGTPIVMMTGGGMLFPQGSGSLSDLTSSAEFLGASFVINKPFRKEALTKVLEKVFFPE